MGRWTEPDNDRGVVDALISEWRESCLIGRLSLLRPGEHIWTEDNFEVLMQKFVANELTDERKFDEKLTEQMDSVELGAGVLMAEVIAVHLVFASQGSVGGTRKSELISIPLEAVGEEFPEEGVVADAVWGGIGGTGQYFNQGRPFFIKYLVQFGNALVKESEDRRRELVSQDADGEHTRAWALRDWLDEQLPDPDAAGISMRNILLHLLFPDAYERMASESDKWQVASTFAALVEGLDPEAEDADVDEILWAIRERIWELKAEGLPPIGDVDFYQSPLREGWDPEDTRAGRRRRDALAPLAALEYKQQVVFYGPPGTGKTFEAKALAGQFIRRQAMRRWGPIDYLENLEPLEKLVSEQVERRQLHPAYSYEDFIGGLRLQDNSTVPTKGHLLLLIERIDQTKTKPAKLAHLPWVLILDEINRVDLSRLLGEVFSALDDRQAPIRLSAAGADKWPPLELPKDLYIIGTMNLIDQAVEQLDFALRRRFFWLLADYREELILPVVRQRWEGLDYDEYPWLRRHAWKHVQGDIEWLAERATELNDAVTNEPLLGPQYKVGHTYFFDVVGFIAKWPNLRPKRSRFGNYLWSSVGKPLPPLEGLWAYSLAPLLSEYLAGSASQRREEILRELREQFLAPVEK